MEKKGSYDQGIDRETEEERDLAIQVQFLVSFTILSVIILVTLGNYLCCMNVEGLNHIEYS